MKKGRPSKPITKERILYAQKMTKSNMSAARFLGISYEHYKRYAKSFFKDIRFIIINKFF